MSYDVFLKQGITHQSVGLTLAAKQKHDEEMWDLSDSLADLYQEVNKREQEAVSRISMTTEQTEQQSENNNKLCMDRQWIDQDTSNGFIRVFYSDSESSRVYPCTLSTTAQKICYKCGRPPNSLHIQLNGDIIRNKNIRYDIKSLL